MFIVHCFILFSVLVLSAVFHFEYWNAIMIIFKFWWGLWNFLRNLFYDYFTSQNEIKNHLWWKLTSFCRSAWKYLAFDTHIGGVWVFFENVRICRIFIWQHWFCITGTIHYLFCPDFREIYKIFLIGAFFQFM